VHRRCRLRLRWRVFEVLQGDICYIAFERAEGKERAPGEPEELDAVCFVDGVALLFAGCVFGFIYVFEAVGEPWNGVFGFEGRETGEEFGRFYEVEDEAADGIEFCLFELILCSFHDDYILRFNKM
jgi:hypothetical protein